MRVPKLRVDSLDFDSSKAEDIVYATDVSDYELDTKSGVRDRRAAWWKRVPMKSSQAAAERRNCQAGCLAKKPQVKRTEESSLSR